MHKTHTFADSQAVGRTWRWDVLDCFEMPEVCLMDLPTCTAESIPSLCAKDRDFGQMFTKSVVHGTLHTNWRGASWFTERSKS